MQRLHAGVSPAAGQRSDDRGAQRRSALAGGHEPQRRQLRDGVHPVPAVRARVPRRSEPRGHGPLQQDEGRGQRPQLPAHAPGRHSRRAFALDARRPGAEARPRWPSSRRPRAPTSASFCSSRRSGSSRPARSSAGKGTSTTGSASCFAVRSISPSAVRAGCPCTSCGSNRARSSERWPSWPINRSPTR